MLGTHALRLQDGEGRGHLSSMQLCGGARIAGTKRTLNGARDYLLPTAERIKRRLVYGRRHTGQDGSAAAECGRATGKRCWSYWARNA
jgi:hypothetical protein